MTICQPSSFFVFFITNILFITIQGRFCYSYKHLTFYFTADRKTYSVGEAIELTITLRTGSNKNRTRGGDQLRVRIYNNIFEAFAPGYVIDHNNGTYTAVVWTHWPGKQMISVTLAYRREAVRAMYYIRKKVNVFTLKELNKIAADDTFIFIYFYLSKQLRLGAACDSSLPSK